METRFALYMRVSTEDQADRDTVEAQRNLLNGFIKLYDLPLIAEYADEGVSGTVPLGQRPEGNRLLKDAAAGRFDCVLVYRVDRLGRSLFSLLDAYRILSDLNITIRSATEPFDTSTPIGAFLFQLLGSLAELEKSTISERMTLGRDRVAKTGKWVTGIVPFGYDLDSEGCLVESERMVESVGLTEADLARELFHRIAEDSTATQEALRLNKLGVPTDSRYANGRVRVTGAQWGPSRLVQMIRNDVYVGEHTIKSQHGPVIHEVPPLIEKSVAERARANLNRNRRRPKGNALRDYTLRGLVICENCGAAYTGTNVPRGREKRRQFYYRCGQRSKQLHRVGGEACPGKHMPAEWLENLVWKGCKEIIENPGEALAEVQKQLKARVKSGNNVVGERQALSQALLAKDQEKERMLTLFRRGRIGIDDLDKQMDAMGAEVAELQQRLNAIEAQNQVTEAARQHITDAKKLLEKLHDRLEEIDRNADEVTKHQIIKHLVSEIRIKTDATVSPKSAAISISYVFAPASSAKASTHGSTRQLPDKKIH